MRNPLLALLALVAFPVLAAAQTPARSETLTARLVPPARVGAFRLASVGQMQGRVGGQLQYRSPDGAEIAANLHPLPPILTCERACDSVTVDLAAAALATAPEKLAHGAALDSIALEREEVVSVPYAGGTAYGRRLVVGWLSEGERMRTDLSLYALGSFVAEVRSTFRPGPERDSVAVRFGREFLRALGQGAGEAAGQATACAGGPADPEVIRVTEPSRLAIDSLRRRVEPALAGFGLRLDPAAREPDTWRTLPLEGWPAGVDFGPWARQASPGFVVAVRLEESAGTARITVSAEARCAPVYPGEDPRSLELALELRTARAVLAQIEGKRAGR